MDVLPECSTLGAEWPKQIYTENSLNCKIACLNLKTKFDGGDVALTGGAHFIVFALGAGDPGYTTDPLHPPFGMQRRIQDIIQRTKLPWTNPRNLEGQTSSDIMPPDNTILGQ